MKRTLKLFISLLICCLMVCSLSVTAFAASEVESNNSVGTAQKVTLGKSVDGSIYAYGDVDFYKYTLSESGRIQLDMTAYMQYYCLYLYNVDGTQLWCTEYNEWNSTVGFRNDVYTLDLIAGTYYVKVTGAYSSYYENRDYYNSTGTYTLKCGFTSAGSIETEPNNSVADADSLSRNGSVKGHIAINDRYDFFKVKLPKSGRLTLDMTAYMQYYCLYVYDVNGTQQWCTEYNQWNSTVGFLNNVYSIDLTAGTYYVKVTGAYSAYYEGRDYDNSYGAYTLKTSFVSAGATETESNNSIAEANTISMTGSVTGQIAINDRYDFYAVTLLKDRRLSFDIVSYMQYYTITIYDANGNQQGYVDNKEWNSTVGYREDSWYIDLSAGTYYIKVSGYRYNNNTYYASTGTYVLTLNHVDAPALTSSNVASSGKIKLSWGAVEGATKYKVYCATSKTGTYSYLTTTTKTSITHSKAVAGKTYYYYVRAVNEYGDTSVKSNIVGRTCDLARPVVSLSNVTSTGKIKVSWKAVDGAVGYEVYRATSKNGTYKLIKTTTGTSITHSSAVAGKTYYYKVKAIAKKDAADSAFSAVKSQICKLARPEIEVYRNGSGKPVVEWDKVSNAKSYKVYIYSSSGKLLKTVTTKNTKLTHSSAVAGKTYTYCVRAIYSNEDANSVLSAKTSIKSR